MKKKKDDKMFVRKPIDPSQLKSYPEIDFNALYQRAYDELGLQQTKRDQIITLYLAMFSFLIPFALSIESISWQVKGLIFMVAAIIGILFALIIIRYRVYKEAYWLCCQSITAMFGFEPASLNKETVQQIYVGTMEKKMKSLMVGVPKKLSKKLYVKKNMFSAETIYFFIHSFITSALFGLSTALICSFSLWGNIAVGIAAGVILFVVLAIEYFRQCLKFYGVLIDGKDRSFNSAFSKAWFLHFFL